MPLSDIDLIRRRSSLFSSVNQVDFILYVYNESFFEEQAFRSVIDLLNIYEKKVKDEEEKRFKHCYWIEVINRSAADLPASVETLCEHFDIHSLTMEDISTLAPYMKLDFFQEQAALYLLMKLISWAGNRVQQQQISFYLQCSKNLLITFQDGSQLDPSEAYFETIRHRLRRDQTGYVDQAQTTRLRTLGVDYLFYLLLDDMIDRYMLVMEKIFHRIDQYDQMLMTNSQCWTLSTLYSIYCLKHDLLYLRILFNPLKEILDRLRRTTSDENSVPLPPSNSSVRVGIKHHVLRRQKKSSRPPNEPNSPLLVPTTQNPNLRSKKRNSHNSIYLNKYIYVYLNDLNNYIDELMDTLDILRESVSFLISFWIALNSDETQETLTILMLISVLFMPCLLVTGLNSTNFRFQPQYEYYYGYYIFLVVLAFLFIVMLSWYRYKRWI